MSKPVKRSLVTEALAAKLRDIRLVADDGTDRDVR
jgi:hypothetical protein